MTARGPAIKYIRGNRSVGTLRVKGEGFRKCKPHGLELFCFLMVLLIFPCLPLPVIGAEGPFVEGIVEVPEANLREKPSTDSPVAAKVKRGDRVKLLGRSSTWYVTRLPDDRLAWGHEMIFKKMKPEETLSLEKDGRSGELRVPLGMVREKPLPGSKPLLTLRGGTRVSLFSESGEWWAIELPDRSLGWAHQRILQERGPGPRKPSPAKDPASPKKPLPETMAWNELREIRFESVSESEEKILFSLTRKETPSISSLKRRIPLVVCEFLGTRKGREMGESIRVDGTIVRRIRIWQREGLLPKVEVLLDLIPVPGSDFQVQPVFFDKESVFALIMRRIERP